MTTQISSTNIQPTTLAALAPVTITSITVTDSSWTPLDDSAVSTSGGFIVITGTNFATGCNVIIGSTNATSVAFVNSTTLRVQVPAMSAGTYVVYVTNTNGTTAIIVNGLTYSGTPTWVTESPLPQGGVGTLISIQLSATGDTPLIYTLQAGSTLPANLTLSSSGLLSGTVSGLTSETTYNFTIVATDPQLQDSPKAFAITIIVGDQFWDFVTLLLPGTTSTSIFNDDASTNNFPVTVFGDTRPNNFGPYTPGYYSNFFDGNGDYLSTIIPSFGTTNFTIEGWVYNTGSVSNTGVFHLATSGFPSTITGIALAYSTTSAGWNLYYANGSQTNGGANPVPNTWYHFAVTRSGTALRLYINGILTVSVTDSTNYSLTSMNIGGYYSTSYLLTGYISNVRVINGTALYTANFTPPTEPLTAVSGTTLLTCQSNRFIDVSTSNATITSFGDTRINGFDPFVIPSSIDVPNLYSVSFDGTGDFLSNASADARPTGDFTVECWVYKTSAGSDNGFNNIFSFGNEASGRIALLIQNNTLMYGTFGTGNESLGGTVPYNTWTHIAYVRSGSSVTAYVNGTATGTTLTKSGTLGNASGFYIGALSTGTGAPLPGQISNLRYIRGTALYTANFTPPTQPLTAIANTSLLTCQNSTLVDNSTNNFAITSAGQAQPIAVTPFTQTFTSQSIAGSGSTFFDGTGDYLTAPANAAFQLTGDFTLEAWIYPTTINNFNMVFGSDNGANSDYLAIRASTIELAIANASYPAWSQSFVVNRWYHIAVTRSSNTLRAFVNGVALTLSSGSATNSSQMFQSGAGLSVGRFGNTSTPHNFTGYISNARVVKGTAVYTAAFTPPTQPLTAVTNTSLLTCQTNQPNTNNMFLDSSTNNFLLSRFGNTTQGTFSPYGENWSVYFSGSSSAITFSSTSAVAFSTQPYTIEGWVNIPAGSNNKQIFNVSGLLIGTGGFGGSTVGALRVFDGTTTFVTSASYLIATDSWNHFAVVREGTGANQFKLYVNGTLAVVGTSAVNHSAQSGFIGAFNSTTDLLTGYISNLRIVKRAVYTTASTTVGTSVFTPSTTPLQPVSDTSLLTCESPNIVDLSVTNLALTPGSGNSVQKFGPFAGTTLPTPYYGAYFDGNGDVLTLPSSSAFNISGNFTIEGWYNFTALPPSGQNDNLWTFSGATTFNPYLYLWGDGTLILRTAQTGGTVFTFTHNFSLGVWYHIAVVKSGTAFTLYINGVSSATGTSSSIVSENKSLIIGESSTFGLHGYLSNFRVVNGQTLYTANFTPSTVPLTTTSQGATASNVSLLTCQSNTFIDNSLNNFAITVSGNSQPTFFNPFTVTYSSLQSYSPSVFGGSMYFDGTGDYLSSTSNAAIGTGPFTIEGWIYPTALGTNRSIVVNSYWNIGDNGGYRLTLTSSNTLQLLASTGTYNTFPAVITSSTALPSANQWYHFAIVRNSSNSIMIYINGVAAATAVTYASSLNLGGGQTLKIGGVISDGTLYEPFLGYISNVRILSGTAVYPSSFVPPVAPVEPVPNTVVLLNGTSAAIYDASVQNNLETLGDSRLATNITKYGNTSMFFDGTDDRLAVPSTPALQFGTGDFTIEFWLYSLDSTDRYVFSIGLWGGSTGVGMIQYQGNYAYGSGATWPANAGQAITPNVWRHIAITRTGGSSRFFFDGVLKNTSADSNNLTLNTLSIGSGNIWANYFGYIQDFRITRGVARYTTNFTPPTTPFPTN